MTTVFEEKNICKAIMRMGLPAMLGQLTTVIYNIADTYFVSLTDEPTMIAAVTLCAPILLIIMSVAVIFGMGGSSVIARLLGEGKRKESGTTLNFCVYAIVISGIIMLLLGLTFLKPLAKLIGADAENIGYTMDYLKYIFMGAPFIMLSNGFVHLSRSVGLIKQSTVGLMLGNVVNIVLDYVFIVVLQKGAGGAALATSIGFVCAVVYYVVCMLREESKGNDLVPLTPKHFAPKSIKVSHVVMIGIPGAMITVLMSVSNIVLNNFIGIYGSNAVAAYGIAYKVALVPIMLSVGLSQGVAALIGYCYGAKSIKRMTDTMKYSMIFGILIGTFFTVIFQLFGENFASIFLRDDEVLLNQTAYFLKILCLSAPLLGIINMVTSYFQALGKAINSLVITILRNAILFIPGVMILNYMWQLQGVIAAQPVVEVILAIICMVMYLKSVHGIKAAQAQVQVQAESL